MVAPLDVDASKTCAGSGDHSILPMMLIFGAEQYGHPDPQVSSSLYYIHLSFDFVFVLSNLVLLARGLAWLRSYLQQGAEGNA